MIDTRNETLVGTHVEIQQSADVIIGRSITLHTLFDQGWNRSSYHNQFHVKAALETVDAVFDSCNISDPLELKAQMRAWNEANPEHAVTDLALLKQAFRIAFACHDVGNITADEPISEQGQVVFADAYRSKGAEDRSKVVAARFIDDVVGEHPHKETISKLVEHVIDQTKFCIGQRTDTPFWLLVQSIDQIGSAYFSIRSNAQLVAGLIQEENGNWNMSLRAMIEFTSNRMRQLFENEDTRNAVYALFETNRYGHVRDSFTAGDKYGDVEQVVGITDVARLVDMSAISVR